MNNDAFVRNYEKALLTNVFQKLFSSGQENQVQTLSVQHNWRLSVWHVFTEIFCLVVAKFANLHWLSFHNNKHTSTSS